jgi:hypothetical protein
VVWQEVSSELGYWQVEASSRRGSSKHAKHHLIIRAKEHTGFGGAGTPLLSLDVFLLSQFFTVPG